MRWKWAIVMLLALPIAARAADDDRKAQISAATAKAVEALRKDISSQVIVDKITVKDLLDQTSGTQMLTDALFRAQQIGGPRFIDDAKCDVRLDISGSRVVQILQQIAATYPKRTPISADQLAVHLIGWDKKTFSATGTSAGAAAVDLIRPGADERAWHAVSDENSKQAVHNAKRVATTQAFTPVASVPIAGGKTVSDAMAIESVNKRMVEWLGSRPITQVEFRDDQNVRVTLAAPADETFEQLRLSLVDQKTLPLPKDETAWMSVKQDFVNKFKPPVGIAPAARATTLPQDVGVKEAYHFPRPEWAQQQLDADASVKLPKSSALLSARAAETTARDNLKAKIEALPLGDGKTIGEAAKTDKRLRDIVAKNVKDAGIRKTEYLPDGTIKIRVYLDLQNVWQSVNDEQ